MIELARSTLRDFHQAGNMSTLEIAISLYRDALNRRPVPSIERFSILAQLAFALYSRFYRSEQPQDLDEATALYREALTNQSHSNRSELLRILSAVLLTRFGTVGQITDLKEALQLQSELISSEFQGRMNTTGESGSWNDVRHDYCHWNAYPNIFHTGECSVSTGRHWRDNRTGALRLCS